MSHKYIDTAFGEMLVLPEAYQNRTLVLCCINKGHGLEPHRIRLPHQFYKEDLYAWSDGWKWELTFHGLDQHANDAYSIKGSKK